MAEVVHQVLDKSQVQSLKALTASEAWKLCQVLWARHSIHKETEKSQALRENQLDNAIYLQGYLDGMKVRDKILESAVTRQPQDESGPVY